jgi:hypothetical protein
LRMMSDALGKIAAIFYSGPQPEPARTDAAWFPALPKPELNLGFYRFYHDRRPSATGATILV